MKRPKGKKYDGVSRPTNEAYKNGWNEIFLNKVLNINIESNTDQTRIK
jgi:hypothetical protein